jgi:multiple sugar transport system permease protein
MPSPNPLQRTTPLIHLPLLVLAVLFMIPLAWLLSAALQPREQVGKTPPELVPRLHYFFEGSTKIHVTPPQRLGVERLLVVPTAGPYRGQQRLVDPRDFESGTVALRVRSADRDLAQRYPAELLRRIPADYVVVKEWRLSKIGERAPRTFYLEAQRVKSEIQPIWGNFAEAVRALTAGERDKARPLPELLGRSVLPWTDDRSAEQTITFVTYLANTLVVAVLGVAGTVLSSALVAYGLSRIRWRGREALFSITLATMMVPFPVLMIPLYSVFRTLGWIGTLLPLWVPAFFGGAFNIFLLRQFFLTIPSELSEAARIDGCGEFEIFWRIILPLARPALSVVALFQFLFVWNDFLGPLIFLTRPQTFTMALGLQQYQSQHGGSESHLLMAASALLVLPVVVLFFFTQKTLIQGISTTGMGGR